MNRYERIGRDLVEAVAYAQSAGSTEDGARVVICRDNGRYVVTAYPGGRGVSVMRGAVEWEDALAEVAEYAFDLSQEEEAA